MGIYEKTVKYIFNPFILIKEGSKKQLEYVKDMEEIQFLPPEKIRELQWRRLVQILDHAYRTCPFYTKRFQSAGLDPSKIRSADDLEQLPVVTKGDIQNNLSEMISQEYLDKPLIKDKTGGSTGSPLVFYYDRERLNSRHAATVRHNRWVGWEIGDKVGLVWGAYSDLVGYRKLKSQIRNQLQNRYLVLDTSSMTDEKIREYVEQLARYRPKILLAYTNSLVLLANYMKENRINNIRPEGIVCTCEVLTPEYRSLIESVFGCKVFDRYGSREVAVIASECDRHEGLHVNADNLYLEFVKDGKNVSPGEVGEILITDLWNFGMPMIRYKIEDMGSPSDKVCSCGRGLPLMEMVAGRVTDFIVTPEGKIVSGVALATYMITNIKGIGQVQLVQDDNDTVKIKMIRNPQYTEDTSRELMERAKKFLGSGMRFEIEFVEEIPKSPSGKAIFSISRVTKTYFSVQ
jgi:phenylacetate-CoA ligase